MGSSPQAVLDAAPALPDHAIAVIGMACRFPGAPDVAAFWRNLREGVESIARFTPARLAAAGVTAEVAGHPNYVPAGGMLGDIDRFDADFFGVTPREAALMDPQQRLFLECAWQALERACCDSERFDGRIAVFAGVGLSAYRQRNLASAVGLGNVTRLQVELSTDKDYMATRTSYKLNLRGPSMTVQTACSTSLTAVQLACQSLLVHQTDVALAGGASVPVPEEEGYWYDEGSILSPDGHCRAFDAAARGTVPGAGVGVVVLKRLEDALADGDHVHAVIRSAAVNNDGAQKAGFTAPSVDGQAEVIAEAHALAGIDPRSVTFVEGHGTGTPVGDPIEVRALAQAFRLGTHDTGFCALGSVKSNFGHLDAAAGVAGLIKAVLALEHREIPPTLHFERANPACGLEGSPFYVNAQLCPWPAGGGLRRAGVSSFGLGGTNVHVVLEEAPAREPAAPGRPGALLVLSARARPALDRAAENLAAHLREHPEADLADVAWSLQLGRRQFAHRRAVVAGDRARALAVLEGRDPVRRPLDGRAGSARVAFLLPGQGAQHPQMGRELYEHEPVFRRWLDRCCDLLAPHLGRDLRRTLYPGPEGTAAAAGELEQTCLAQPALFAVEYALARTWMEWGLRPAAMLGHSLGEYVAACLAGVLGLEDGLELVALRGRLMQEAPPGTMLAVGCPEDEVERRLPAGLSIAAVNGPRQCVVSGPTPLVEAFRAELGAAMMPCRRLATSHAFHSELLGPVVAPFVEAVRRVELRPPELPYISNVHGGWITAAEATDPAYWGRQLREPVRFDAGVQTLLAEPGLALLEVGPGVTLTTLARLRADASQRTAVPSLRHPQDAGTSDREAVLAALGRLWTVGAPVDWTAFTAGDRRRSLPLPTYPFERRRHWVEWQPAAEGEARPLQLAADPAAEEVPFEPDRPFVAPQTKLETMVADIWRQCLGVERPIGVNDSFFALGGQSLLAVEIASALRGRLELPVSLATVFQNPTIYELARALETIQRDVSAAAPRSPARAAAAEPPPESDLLPLAPEQEETWRRWEWSSQLGFNYAIPLWFDGRLDLPALEHALRTVVQRHPELRARFEVRDGVPFQRIAPAVTVTLPVTDLQHVPAAERRAAARAHLLDYLDRRFDPLSEHLWRASLVRLSPTEHVLAMTLDELVCDANGRGNLIRELAELYQSRRDGATPRVPELTLDPGEYARRRRRWLASPEAAGVLEAWRSDLRGAAALPLRGDRSGEPPGHEFAGVRLGVPVPDDLLRRLRAACGRERVSRYVFALAAFSALLSRFSGRTDVVVTSGTVNRVVPGSEHLVGGYTAFITPRCRWTGDPSFRELLRVAGDATLSAYSRKDVPVAEVAADLGWPARTLRRPDRQFHLAMHWDNGHRLDGVEARFEYLYLGRFGGELGLFGYETPDDLEIMVEYRTALFEASTMRRFGEDLLTLLDRASDDPQRPLSALLSGLDSLMGGERG